MTGADEEWVKAAMTDDTMVVELLVRLHGAAPPPPPLTPAALPLEWSVRQRRSRPMSVSSSGKKQAQRASPTTPLSWSGATSLSGGSGGSGGGGCEESSRPSNPKLSAAARSKVNGDSDKTSLKRSRKKKTLPELKDEESSLLKERRELKREIAALRMNLEKQRATNANLKRMKIELQPLPGRETSLAEESVSDHLQQKTTSNPSLPAMPSAASSNDTTPQSSNPSSDCPKQDSDAAPDPKFVLPDLNMPFEEDPSSDVICGGS